MVSFAIFSISLLGLLAILECKALELNKNARTPLAILRRVGDPMLAENWKHYSARCRKAAFTGLRASLLWASATMRKTEAAFDAAVHGITARLNRYLRTRRLHTHRGSKISAHLKTVLEKTEKHAEPPDSTSS